MIQFKLYVFTLFCFLKITNVSGNDDSILELKQFYELYISRKSFGVRQELNEELCQLQNNLTSNNLIFTDATGKIPAGILIGNMNHFGQYEQCLSVDENVEDVNIKGKYCMMQVTISISENAEESSPTLPGMTLSGLFGVCVASACEATFIDQSFNGNNISSEELFCREANDKPVATQDIVAIVLFFILGILLLMSTGYHLTRKLIFNEDVSKLAKSFSIRHNVTRLTSIPKGTNTLSSINGLRALSMVWVVVGHTYTTSLMGVLENPIDLFSWITSKSATKITAATLAVDTFFYLAAFLLTWSVLKKFKSLITFVKAVPLLYLNRYLRLTPTMAALMLLQVSFFNHVSDGPDWRPVISAKDACMESWWVNFLYLQNYLRPGRMCLPHSWYLAVDMQLYLTAPILIAFLYLTMKFAISSLTVATLASLGAALGYCFYYNFDVMFGLDSENLSFMDRYYVNTIPRSPPFILGIVVAYIVFTLKRRNITIAKKLYIAFHWIVTIVLLVLPVYGTYTTINHNHSQVAINFFNAWHRPAWALGVGGIIVASMHGFGGPIGWFLSFDMWIIPARLSYAMYLIHYPIMFCIVGSQKSPGRFSDSNMLFRFLGDLGLTILAAFLLNMVVEAPFAEISNLLFEKFSGGKKNYQNNDKDQSPSSIEEGKVKNRHLASSSETVMEKGVVSPIGYNQFHNDVLTEYTDFKREKYGRS